MTTDQPAPLIDGALPEANLPRTNTTTKKVPRTASPTVALIYELNNQIVMGAAVADYMKFIVASKSEALSPTIWQHVPVTPTLWLPVRQGTIEVDLKPDLMKRIALLQYRFQFARALLTSCAEFQSNAHCLSVSSRAQLAIAWTAFVDTAEVVVESYRSEPQLPNGIEADTVLQFVVSVSQGQNPSIYNNEILLPKWLRVRKSPRYVINRDATLHYRMLSSSVIARDASQGGMGLCNSPELNSGEIVCIRLDTGRRFVGRVAWSESGNAGIEFAKPLQPSDPLLAGDGWT